jgi:hydrogenase maturation protease
MPYCLVIGYGNLLRRDDGVGIEAAQAIAAMNLPGVSVITRQQLVPELAAPISEADAVIFVDADVTARGQVELRLLKPACSSQILAHAADPCSLLTLAKQIFGGGPTAWLLAIPVEDFGFGFGLSRRSQEGLRAAVKLIQQQVRGLAKMAK